MKRVHSAHNIQQANLILHYLEQHNIKAIILNQYNQGALGELPFTHGYPEIWVEEAVNDQAAKLITSFENLPLSDKTILCNNCQETNPDNFESCWSCGAILNE